MLPLAILCGGLGTRMRPETLTVPKPLIEVSGEPFLGHLLRSVAVAGVTDVVLLVGYLGQMIVDFVGSGAGFGLHARYVFDGDRPLGTAGAVRRALPLLGERFLMTYGDAYLRVDYEAVVAAFERSKRGGIMTVYPWTGAGTTPPNTAVADGLVTFYGKETHAGQVQFVDYGLSAFHARAFKDLSEGEPADLRVVNSRLIAEGDLAAFIVDDLPIEIGSQAGLQAAHIYLRRPS